MGVHSVECGENRTASRALSISIVLKSTDRNTEEIMPVRKVVLTLDPVHQKIGSLPIVSCLWRATFEVKEGISLMTHSKMMHETVRR